jgi:hypothetical protein
VAGETGDNGYTTPEGGLMTATKTEELLDRAIERLRRLSPERLRTADDFLAYLDERESNEATAELLRIPGAVEAYEESLREMDRGEMVPFKELRRKR